MTARPIPILITTAIVASAAKTSLTDTQARLLLTLEGVRRWRLTAGVTNVIVCDGSGYDLGQHIDVSVTAENGCACEILTFTNDLTAVRIRGKGYGEGEIVRYALLHSRTLNTNACFAKCTGKLWVSNYDDCARRFNGVAAFDFAGYFHPRNIDTRFYIVDRQFFLNELASQHHMVDDERGFYLEHAFQKALRAHRLSAYAMYPTPRIWGVSGSTGESYRPSAARALLRDVRTLMIKACGRFR